MSYDTILAKSPSIIFRPGVPSSGLAVATWSEVQAFVTLREGNVIVFVDDGITAAHVSGASGITDFQGRGEIRPYRPNVLAFSTLTIDDGATLKGLARISETLFLVADTRGAVPSLDWDYTPDATGTSFPAFYLEKNAALGQAPTATTPAIVVPSGQTLFMLFSEQGGVFTDAPAPLVHLADATAFLTMSAFGAELQNFAGLSLVPAGWVDGAGVVQFIYDSSTISHSIGLPQFSAGSSFHFQTDTHTGTLVLLGNAANVFAALQAGGFLRQIGTLSVKIEGFGGSGGGGGGQGGTVGAGAGVGGGGAGGCQYQVGSFDFDLTHQLDVTVGAGGAAGAAGAAAGGAGGDGSDGQPSLATDATSGAILASLVGSNRGGGGANGVSSSHGGATYVGAFIPKSSDIGVGSGGGFLAAGGFGGNAGLGGTSGQNNLLSLNPPGGGIDNWSGGAAGSGAAGGGGGGGGGAGTFADGGAGGAGGAGVGGAGGAPAANTGAGGGGGGGGGADGSAGGAGGAGATGRVKLTFTLP